VAHTCNPSYSGDRDQEDCDLKPAWANSSQDLVLKKPTQKRAGGVAQGIGPEFKPQYQKKEEREKERKKMAEVMGCHYHNASHSICHFHVASRLSLSQR
jgi:hypothetical protein